VRVRFGAPIDPKPFIEAVKAGRMSKRQAYDAISDQLKTAITSLAPAAGAA
jgi:hypothetical protein